MTTSHVGMKVADGPARSLETPHADETPRAVAPTSSPAHSISVEATAPARRSNAVREGRSPGARAKPTSRVPDLSAEVRALSLVRTRLHEGEPALSRVALDLYRRAHPGGALWLESEVLEIDIELSQGNVERARRLSRALLKRPDAGRYRIKLTEILARTRLPTD